MVLAGQPVNILSNVLPVLILIIGVSNCVHVVARFAEEAELSPGDRAQATRRTMEHMTLACLLTLGTTAIGFGSLLAAKSYVLRMFGAQAAVGMLCQYVSIMLILGTMLPRLRPPRHSPLAAEGRRTVITPLVMRVGLAVGRHPRLILAFGVAIVAGSLLLSRNVVVNSHLLETYDDDHPASQELHFVEKSLSGILPIEVNLRTDDPSTFLQPDVYRRIAEFEAHASAHPAITLARSYVDLYQEVYANFRRRPELRRQLPTDDADGGRRIRRSAQLVRRIEGLVHYRAFMSGDGCEARILLRARDEGTRTMRALIGDLRRELGELFRRPPPSSFA